MESDPWQFADGIRGKVLWHNEYRMQGMYAGAEHARRLKDRTFDAAFLEPRTPPAPFHNNTCDGCHVRNGSGIPINTAGTLDPGAAGVHDGQPCTTSPWQRTTRSPARSGR